MRIPSIYLPIDIELFDDHFKRFFMDFIQERPDYLKHTLNRTVNRTGGFRYEIEFEDLRLSTPPEPKMVISEIEAFVVDNNRIEIKAAAINVLYPDNRMGWGEVFLDEFYKMINLKWNVKPFFPNVEDTMDMPMNAARVQLDHDFGISDITVRKVPSSDDNDGVKEKTALLSVIDDEEIIRRIDGFNNALHQGLPRIEASNEVSPTFDNHPRGPTLKILERAKTIKEIKDRHLTWSQPRVAMEASKVLGEYISIDTVRYCYRVMELKWERADRVR
jgi:hypothetical protein